jgi:hypothetical protein
MVKINIHRNQISVGIMVFITAFGFSQKPIEKVFKPMWETTIGITTYRTNMAFENGNIFIGSNGIDRNFHTDSLDGVFEINAKTGKIVHHYVPPFLGDNDVTGIVVSKGKLFFGTDNFAFYCFDIKTKKMLWYKNLPYDVESAPVVTDFNGDGNEDVFFSVQNYGFYALNGLDGTVIWEFTKIDSHEGNVSALLYDCNQDGVMDVITSGRKYHSFEIEYHEIPSKNHTHFEGNFHFALNGKTGELLWVHRTDAGVHASPIIAQFKSQPHIVFTDYYGFTQLIKPSGEKSHEFAFDSYAVFSTSVSWNDLLIIGTTNVFDLKNPALYNYVSDYKSISSDSYKQINSDNYASATPIIADLLNTGSQQICFPTEKNELIIANLKGEKLEVFLLKAGAEASLFVHDFDNDGKLEFLIATVDGKLRCYKTNSKGKVIVNKFR